MINFGSTFCATLADEWVRAGVRDVFVAPGSRSTPLALALAARTELRCEVVLDERVAGFMALGSALAGGRPAIVLTTSGTAVTHLHAAVVEAHLSEVPLIVCSADRPPELHGVGAAQTIDQAQLFGGAVRAYLDLGVPDEANRGSWRSLAARAVCEATGRRPGPVQLNLGFREPLVGELGPLPQGRADGQPWHRRFPGASAVPQGLLDELTERWAGGRRGVLLAGAGIDDPAAVLALGEALGWPVVAEPRSGCRVEHPVVVAHVDTILRHAGWASWAQPEVVVQLGAPAASKVLAGWLASLGGDSGAVDAGAVDGGAVDGGAADDGGAGPGVELVVVNRAGAWWDADRRSSIVVECAPEAFADALRTQLSARRDIADPSGRIDVDSPRAVSPKPSEPRAIPTGMLAPAVGEADPAPAVRAWLAGWRAADDAIATTLTGELDEPVGQDPPHEPAVARHTFAAAHRHGAAALMVSSSMPVRDLEWYLPRQPMGATPAAKPPRVLANRGANGIDGVVSTAVGAALALDAPVWVLIGDLAMLHDSNALLNLTQRRARLRIVVVDNAGGGIFSFLPQASAVAPERFEQLFGTAQCVALTELFAAHGIVAMQVDRASALVEGLDALGRSDAAVAALVVRVPDRQANVAIHERLHAAALAGLPAAAPVPAQAENASLTVREG